MASDFHQSFPLGWAVGVNRFSHLRFQPDPVQNPPFQQGSRWLPKWCWIPSQVSAGEVPAMMRQSWPCLASWRTHLKVRPLKDAMAASPLMTAIFPRRVERPWRMVSRGRDAVKRWLAAVLAFPGSVPAPKRLLNIETASGKRNRAPNVGLVAPTGSTTQIVDSSARCVQAWRRRTFQHISF